MNIQLTHDEGPLKPCRRCAGRVGIVAEGKGPHYAQIVCAQCGAKSTWLSKAQYRTIALSAHLHA